MARSNHSRLDRFELAARRTRRPLGRRTGTRHGVIAVALKEA